MHSSSTTPSPLWHVLRPVAIAAAWLALPLALLPAYLPSNAAAEIVFEALIVDLIAGNPKNGETIAGRVEVWNDLDDLTITYITNDDWCMTQTNLHVATIADPADPDANIPQNRPGNPNLGQFAYGDEWPPEECVFIWSPDPIPIDDSWVFDVTVLVVAAHATLVHLDTYADEDAWAKGDRFVERGNWAMYFTKLVDDGRFECLQCPEAFCGTCSDEDPYICTSGPAIGGCQPGSNFWILSPSCSGCCDQSTC